MRYVIIGNGVAGTHAAEAIRQLDSQGSITMIGDETSLPYCRPMISDVLSGSIQPNTLLIRNAAFYDTFKIKPLLGKRVTAIHVGNKTLTIEHEQIPFDKLLIATGADPRPIKAKGMELKGIFVMRNEAHIRQMLSLLPHARRAVILGGGLVAFKASYGLLQRGLKVTMLISSSYPLAMQLDETAGKMILNELMKQGMEVKVGVETESFEGSQTLEKVHLSDGTTIPCDMAVIGKGVLPSLSFVPRDNIQIDLGILVNQYMETSAADIYAAGDVAETIDIARKTRWVNAIWPEAVNQGRIAGMNMAGRSIAYKGSLSRNTIRIFGLDIMTAGIVNPPNDSSYQVISLHHPHTKIYRKLVFRDNTLVGMVMINSIEQGGMLISMIYNEIPIKIPKEKLLSPSFNYRQLICA